MVGDTDAGGIVDGAGSVLFREYRTVAVSTLTAGEELPVIALEMTGRLNKGEDTIGVVYLMSVMDAGMLAGALMNAAHRIGGTADTDFKVGVAEGAGRG